MRFLLILRMLVHLLLVLTFASISEAGNKSGAFFQNDGPARYTPSNLYNIADAIPKNEVPIAGANHSYRTMGQRYYPISRYKKYTAIGKASWYGRQFNGRRTASGERYNMFAMTAAHRTLPIPSYARVTNLANNKSIIVRINDRGPFSRTRIMDLSYAAAYQLGFIKDGRAKVKIERVFPKRNRIDIFAEDGHHQPLLNVMYSQLGLSADNEMINAQ